MALVAPESIDPSRTSPNDRTGLLILKQICDPLVAVDPKSGELKPGSAESWQLSEDARKMTFKLRSGLRFHNGREVVAEDYVFSMSRFVQKHDRSKEFFLLETVAGYADVREGRAETLAGVKAPDPLTLEVELSEPFAEFPAVVAHPGAGSAVPREVVEERGDAFAAHPVCTGPYSITAPWDGTQDIRLVRFAEYGGSTEAFSRGGAGYVDEIVLGVTSDEAGGYARFEEGEVDIAEVPLEQLAEARELEGALESAANGIVTLIGLPVGVGPFDNLEFRRALALGLDREDIVERLLAGSRQIARGFLPPGAGPAARDQVCAETAPPRASPPEARQALAAAGVDPAATNPKIYFNAGSGHESWLTVVAEQWQGNLGMTSTLSPLESLEHLVDYLVEGPDGPFRWAWSANYPSPESIFRPLFAAGSPDNYSRFDHPEFQERLAAARAAVDDGERRKAYIDAGAVLCGQIPMLPVWLAQSHFVFGADIASAIGVRLDPQGHPLLRELGRR